MEANVYTNLFDCIFHETAECTAADAFKYAGDNIVFASGSPFENVNLGNFPSQLLLCLETFLCSAVKAIGSVSFLLWNHEV